MQFHKEREKILVIDFGSQVTKLIGRNIRELGVYSEIITLKDFKKIKEFHLIKGIIFSGGPSSVTSKKYQTISKKIFEKNIPILGICYGLQLIAKLFGGKIKLLPPRKGERFASALTSMNLSRKVYKINGKIELKSYINSLKKPLK